MRVCIVGGSGYAGGELLRYLLRHPKAEVAQVASSSHAGEPIHRAHPNLRRATDQAFVHPDDLRPCDLLFLAMPHGEASRTIDRWTSLAPRVIDLSGDFRLRDPRLYEEYYGFRHASPEYLGRFAYGLPELHRGEIEGAGLVAGVGCVAAATILALAPLARAGLVEEAVVDAKTGSSAAGAKESPASAHPERSGVMRLFAATGHRHTPEVEQELAVRVHLSIHAVEAVRGILATCHAFVTQRLETREVWRLYREAYAGEPFVRIVREAKGLYRLPEPKILAGTNLCDVGFEVDPRGRRVVAVAALDNLGKGAAGSAVQCMNLMAGYPETTGLEALGLHPI